MKGLTSRLASLAGIGVFAIMAMPAFAQTSADTQVSGEFAAATINGPATEAGVVDATFQCKGEPTCTGTYQATFQDSGCSNTFPVSGNFKITGFDLSHPGPLTLNVTLSGFTFNDQMNADGTCSIRPGTSSDLSLTLIGAWDGVSQGGASATFPDDHGDMIYGALAFTAARNVQPVFPMTVTSNITPTVASATAQFQPKPEDVGKTESVFVFAHAPASQVQGAKRAQRPNNGPIRVQDGGDPCVLAQVDPSGKLVAASASTMGAAFTGVLSAQGQSVTLLNNVPTPGVAGATVFTGYGSDANSMLSSGVYQGAVTVPGAVSGATTLVTAAAPATPGALSGLWSSPAEQGWGIYFAQRRNILFAAWFTYDAGGNPKWYTASDCAMQSSMASSGRCTGQIFEVSGPQFFGVPFDASRIHVSAVGNLQVDFTDAGNATMTYTVNGTSRTVPIVRQLFASGTTAPAIDYTDLWWASPASSESGWGLAISQQFNKMFLAWFVYDAAGKPVWYVATDCPVPATGNGCSGALYTVAGPPFGPTFDPQQVHATQVGTVTLIFSGPNDGSLSYTVGTTTATKAITRQIF